MKDNYVGKCSQKSWSWKQVSKNFLTIPDTANVGTIKCEVYTKRDKGFSESDKESIASLGYSFVYAADYTKVTFYSDGSDNRKSNIKRYNAFKSVIEKSGIVCADKVLLGVKKSPSQVHVIRCGLK